MVFLALNLRRREIVFHSTYINTLPPPQDTDCPCLAHTSTLAPSLFLRSLGFLTGQHRPYAGSDGEEGDKRQTSTSESCRVRNNPEESDFNSLHPLLQRSPNFLAPGTCFLEDMFLVWDGFRMIQVCYIQAHLLCSLVPSRPRTNTIPQPGGWGPLLYWILSLCPLSQLTVHMYLTLLVLSFLRTSVYTHSINVSQIQ